MKKSLDSLHIHALGYVKIHIASTGQFLGGKHNDVQPFAKEAITNLLGKRVEYAPKFIEVFQAGVSFGQYPITGITYPGANQIEYTVLVPGENEIETVDEMRLLVDDLSIFSTVEEINIAKPPTEAILITWTLTIT